MGQNDIQKEFVCNRALRVAQATYVVSNLLADTEPLKTDLRRAALEVFHELFELDVADESRVLGNLEKVMALLDIATTARLFSDMNARILKDECVVLKDMVVQRTQDVLLPSNFFEDETYQTDTVLNDMQNDIVIQNDTPKPETSAPSQKNELSDRKTRIIQVVKKKGEATIHDIKKVVTDCSEKTIQRDLTDLIKKGTIARRGKRRWATYVLIS